MEMNQQDKIQEELYLKNTLSFLQDRLEIEYKERITKEDDIIAYRREMYENASHHSQDFNKLAETVQYLNPMTMQNLDYEATQQRVALYEKMKKSPYFARIDFDTQRWGTETIYIGIGNLENEDTFETYVYDWRAPISSIFYRYEIGPASYEAPVGTIDGQVTLKRQYEIKDGKLQFFFDSSVNIVDDILKEALSQNSSPKMRTIVETIQREQDLIIRDVDHDLLIVQGVAGSGKTSIALHRAAYLMYQGLQGRLSASNMILISPNSVFAQYISDVLPDLGEENIQTVTFEKLFYTFYGEDVCFKRRINVLEEILVAEPEKRILLQDNLRFKSSPEFLEILNRLIRYFERHLVPFTDIMYEGKTLFKKELLKSRFLESGSRSLPVQVRLDHIETLISERLQQRRPYRLKKLEDFFAAKSERSLDFKTAARLVNTKQTSRIMQQVRTFTRINFKKLYTLLFQDEWLFEKLSQGLTLPKNISQIIKLTQNQLEQGVFDYGDAMALFLLRLRMDTSKANLDIRQVVVDEAQDYSPVHFEILSRLFPSAKYTVLGDINQTIVETDSLGLYHAAEKVLNKRNSKTITLNKSFRCSYEITTFASQFSDDSIEIEQLDRFEESPKVIRENTDYELLLALVAQLKEWQNNKYGTIAVICKNAKESTQLYIELREHMEVRLFTDEETAILTGIVILPVYLAKGLEFDAVAVYNTDADTYNTDDDRRLLYVSCTRALHRLSLFYTEKISPLILSLPTE